MDKIGTTDSIELKRAALNLVFDSDSKDIRFSSIFKKKIFDDRERERGLDHSERKESKCDKMSCTGSIALKIASLSLFLDSASFEISFVSILEKKFFDENFSKSRIFDFQNSIKSELLTRSNSNKRR